jgi:hypothetical protein
MIHVYNYTYSNDMETGTSSNLLPCVRQLKYEDNILDSIYDTVQSQ